MEDTSEILLTFLLITTVIAGRVNILGKTNLTSIWSVITEAPCKKTKKCIIVKAEQVGGVFSKRLMGNKNQ